MDWGDLIIDVLKVVANVTLLSAIIMVCWNYALVGVITGVGNITFLQAVGIYVFCNILFKDNRTNT